MPLFIINPTAKPRMTRKDKWSERPAVLKYRGFSNELYKQVVERKIVLSDAMQIIYFVPMPKSWSQKKKDLFAGTRHKQKPDIDNYDKAVLDSIFGYKSDDSHVWHVKSTKVWAYTGAIWIETIDPLDQAALLSHAKLIYQKNI